MTDKNLTPPCGLYCGDCEYLGKSCTGCGHVEGKPFWTAQFNIPVCPIYDCCVNHKRLAHCGMCGELPCDIFLKLRDPSASDEQFERSLRERQQVLHARREKGD